MHTVRSGILAFTMVLSLLSPALAQEGDGVDINMNALKNKPDNMPAMPTPAPKVKTDKSKVDKVKKFTGKSITVLFEPGSVTLQPAATQRLDDVVAQAKGKIQRLELKAYAGNDKQSSSDTRRLSLQRAIAVRGYLMDKGMDGTRIAVRPQGPAALPTDPPERVDVRYLEE